MKVVLVQDVVRVGKRGDGLEVKDGYGRNFLVARGLARHADEAALRDVAQKRASLEARHQSKKDAEQSYREGLAAISLHFRKKASDKGHLFAGVSADDIIKALHMKGFRLTEERMISGAPLKTTGQHTIEVHFGEAKIPVEVLVESNE